MLPGNNSLRGIVGYWEPLGRSNVCNYATWQWPVRERRNGHENMQSGRRGHLGRHCWQEIDYGKDHKLIPELLAEGRVEVGRGGPTIPQINRQDFMQTLGVE